MYVHVCGREYAHECSTHRGQMRALDPLELELELVVSGTV